MTGNTQAAEAGRPANSERGEITLRLEDHDFVLRPSHEAIAAFEEATGRGLFELAQDAVHFRLKLTEAATIATECIRAWGRATNSLSMQNVNVNRIRELIMEGPDGFKGALETLANMLAMASTGGYTGSGEVKAATATKTLTSEQPAAA